jgi:competence protein ComEC
MASNFLAGPITGLWVMPWGLAAMLLMPLGLDRIPLELMGFGVGWVNDIARTVAGWPGAQVHVPPMSALALGIGSAGLCVLCLWQGRLRWAGLLFLAVAVAQPYLSQPPDVLIDEDAKVVAITDGHGHVVLRPGKGDSFIRDVWRDRYGASSDSWMGRADLHCDADGCILTRHGRRALIALTPAALAEDCASVDAAVSFEPGRAFCRSVPVSDVFDLRRHGALALRMTEHGVTARFVDDGVGDRRWSPAPKPRPRRVVVEDDAETETTSAPEAPPEEPES